MTDRWIGVIWAAFAAAILGVCVAAATSGEAPSTTLLVALVVIPLLVTVSARLSRSRRSRRKRKPHDAAIESSGARSVRDPARRISRSSEPQSAISRKPDWEAVASMCVALDIRHLDWLRANDFAMPWLDVRVRPVIELEPLLAAAARPVVRGRAQIDAPRSPGGSWAVRRVLQREHRSGSSAPWRGMAVLRARRGRHRSRDWCGGGSVGWASRPPARACGPGCRRVRAVRLRGVAGSTGEAAGRPTRLRMAPTEKEGFEPSIRVAPDTALAGQRLQPLGHFSRCVGRGYRTDWICLGETTRRRMALWSIRWTRDATRASA